VGHDHTVSAVAFLPPSGAQLLSCGRDKSVRVWDVATGFCVRVLRGHDEWVRALAVSPDGALAATASNDQTVRVWTVGTGAPLRELREHEHVVEAVAFSNAATDAALPRLLRLRAGGGGGGGAGGAAATADDGAASAAAAAAPATAPAAAATLAAGAFLVSGSRDKTVRVWAVATGACLFTLRDHTSWVRAVAFHPCGTLLLSAGEDRALRAFDLAQDGRCVRSLDDAHSHFITSLAIHPRLPLAVTAGVGCDVKVWELR
jgi:platelet-activating factor acetylhydrolase IB subunit alpha